MSAPETVLDTVGNTPLVRVSCAAPGVELWAKCEWFNPGGSVKDRAARQMILDGLANGSLTPEREIIDATSGNTGIALAMIGAALGFKVTLVMPSNVSQARKHAMEMYGASIIYSDPMDGTDGAIIKCDQMVAATPDRWFRPDQYRNESNTRAHFLTTGPEILQQTGGRITHFVAGIGTSGTVMGTSRFLKKHDPSILCYAAEPNEELHGLEGWKHMASAIVPALWKPELLDGVISVPTEAGWDEADALLATDHLFVGRGGGAAVWAARQLASDAPRGSLIVTVLPDGGERYLE